MAVTWHTQNLNHSLSKEGLGAGKFSFLRFYLLTLLADPFYGISLVSNCILKESHLNPTLEAALQQF